MASKKHIYLFRSGKADGNASMKNLLGGKGANLAEMCNLGLPVPAGFTISTEVCLHYFSHKNKLPATLHQEIKKNLSKLEKIMGTKLGDKANPLLLSIRSGSRASMPGMMDSILNLGLNDKTVQGLAEKSGNPRFAYDSYRRFLQMFASVVLGVDAVLFEKELHRQKKYAKAEQDSDLTVETLKVVTDNFKKIILNKSGKPFPQNPQRQLQMAITALFESWNNQRAKDYRAMYKIPESWGTAANVQAMVFGNGGEDSGTGVAFTKNPSTGENRFFGEFLINAQGEDVVAGIRTPIGIIKMEKRFPRATKQLLRMAKQLENRYKDMLDIEFTIENKKLWLLQVRVGKRTAAASIKIAVEMAKAKKISKRQALCMVEPEQLEQLLHKTIDKTAKVNLITKGLPASPGAAVGMVVFNSRDAIKMAEQGKPAILVRYETSPDDLSGMAASVGILTVHGGMTSHAAVVARGMGKCCISGAVEVQISEENQLFTANKTVLHKGDWLTLDGSGGRVLLGKAAVTEAVPSADFETLMSWADKASRLSVWANGDTTEDAKLARRFGAKGIGLCRTEHMFFAKERILAVREMIIAGTRQERAKALRKLLPMQRKDFKGILKVMQGLPVTIRLLDPPLHEFLPKDSHAIASVAHDMGLHLSDVKQRIQSLSETNPMLGHRGCRLGITYLDIYEMQAKAIYEATAELIKKGIDAKPEVMIPLVGTAEELKICREMVQDVADNVSKAKGVKLPVSIGTMIELPRAAVTANEIVKYADFFSFGTNDLTQTTIGLSRDDSASLLPIYLARGIMPYDPFISIDEAGVGKLMEIGIKLGRSVKKRLKIGICGEHGGDPKSIHFCHKIGIDYLSCSPYRIPIARLAAAQAAIGGKI